MKVTKNTLNKKQNNEFIKVDFEPINCLCDECLSEFVIESEDDIKELKGKYGWSGLLNVICPCCGERTVVDYSIKLTKDNVEYPKHFAFFKERNKVHIEDDNVQKKLRELIERMENPLKKDTDFLYTAYGDMFLIVFREDDGYYAVVTHNYEDCYIN